MNEGSVPWYILCLREIAHGTLESQTQINELRQIPSVVWAAQDSEPRPRNQCDRPAGTTPQIKVKAQTGWYVQYKNDSLSS